MTLKTVVEYATYRFLQAAVTLPFKDGGKCNVSKEQQHISGIDNGQTSNYRLHS